MDLLKYLEPMKNLPNRFSNLAFWRGVRKLKDEVVSAFEYVDSWGKSIEIEIANLTTENIDYTQTKTLKFPSVRNETQFHVIEDVNKDTIIAFFKAPSISLSELPSDFGELVGIKYLVALDTMTGSSDYYVLMNSEIKKTQTSSNTFNFEFMSTNSCGTIIDKLSEHTFARPYHVSIKFAILVYYPQI